MQPFVEGRHTDASCSVLAGRCPTWPALEEGRIHTLNTWGVKPLVGHSFGAAEVTCQCVLMLGSLEEACMLPHGQWPGLHLIRI